MSEQLTLDAFDTDAFAGVHEEAESTRGWRGPAACDIVGITYRQLDYWARTNLVQPSIASATGVPAARRATSAARRPLDFSTRYPPATGMAATCCRAQRVSSCSGVILRESIQTRSSEAVVSHSAVVAQDEHRSISPASPAFAASFMGSLRCPGIFPGGEARGPVEGGAGAGRIGDALSGDIEGRAVVGAGADDWEAEGEVHAAFEGKHLHGA